MVQFGHGLLLYTVSPESCHAFLVVVQFQIDWSHASLLCASSLTTASLTSLLLSMVVICVILISRKFAVNPDNIATPIAASLGDLTTLGVLSLLGGYSIPVRGTLIYNISHDLNRRNSCTISCSNIVVSI